ncbi:HFR102Cp [Eremothecium sinecaudum]|uniref:HFR102Cp n=1 Tax=Eremothecium sinecaudum TaxID=45286 RepID=A0A0X8HV01_9SACH|nr:HFR102Cp [Eremothecium sinecaudum]AMD21957.1 HFR102Cp [Eremothecium sinecaudum]
MGLLGKKKSTPQRKLTKADHDAAKIHTSSLKAPILQAVNEAQPFEQAAQTFHNNATREGYATKGLRDVFGKTIITPDISNPTRERDERPLDTIRSFEYAISGDIRWAEQLETERYGFRVRPEFVEYSAGNNRPASRADDLEQGVYDYRTVAPGVGQGNSSRHHHQKSFTRY